MKSFSFITLISLSLTGMVLADHYQDLAAQGYRWVIVNGPYACTTEEDVERIVAHRTDATELDVVQNYLIPGTLAEVIKEDRSRGTSEMRLGSITTPLWTYTRSLSPSPVRDTYGVIETPQNTGLIPTAETVIIHPLQDSSKGRTQFEGSNREERIAVRSKSRTMSERFHSN
jgi:hypothetical protein